MNKKSLKKTIIEKFGLKNLSNFLNINENNLKDVAINSHDANLTRLQYSFIANEILLRIFDKNRNTLIVVADTPEKYWHSRNSSKVLYVPQHQFSPLIDFSVGGWSIQVAMETVDIQAVYEFILPVSEIESLSNVSLKFVNENDLRSFLDPIL